MKAFLRKNYFTLLMFLLVGLFVVQAGYFIFNVQRGVPPDEIEHLVQITNYFESPSLFIPAEDYEKSNYGTLNQSRFFYHMLLGKLGHLNILGLDQTIFMRLINLIFSLIYLFAFYKLLKLVFEKERYLIITAFGIQTNILMFTFLSSSVNYDNLVNLLAISSIYFTFKHLSKKSVGDLFLVFICMGLGMITKISFGPLMVGLFFILGIAHRKNFKKLFSDCWQFIIAKKFKNIVITISLFLIFLTNVLLFSFNHIKYGGFFPKCHQIYSQETCSTDDPNYAMYNIKSTGKLDPIDPITYLEKWSKLMEDQTFGIFAHKSINLTKNHGHIFSFLFFLFSIFFIRQFNPRKNLLMNISLGLVIFYTLFLAFFVNYQSYLFNGVVHAGVQGRYLFPVLPLMIVIFVHYVLNTFKAKIQAILSIVLISLFIYLSFPSYFFSPQRELFEESSIAIILHPSTVLL